MRFEKDVVSDIISKTPWLDKAIGTGDITVAIGSIDELNALENLVK